MHTSVQSTVLSPERGSNEVLAANHDYIRLKNDKTAIKDRKEEMETKRKHRRTFGALLFAARKLDCTQKYRCRINFLKERYQFLDRF